MPQLPRLAGEAKSYAERLFKFPNLGQLDRDEAAQALTKEVAERLNRTSDQLGPTRARLIDKGLLYTPGHGLTAFTVPQFDRYMRRNYDLRVPPIQTRRRRARPPT